MSPPASTVSAMSRFHPWRALRAATHINVRWSRALHLLGHTDGRGEITLHPDQLQAERRCTLTHEMVHLEWGHAGACSPAVEVAVRRETARRLVSIGALLDALAWTGDWHEAADELWVTVEVLRDRLDGLTAGERAQVAALAERVERGA